MSDTGIPAYAAERRADVRRMFKDTSSPVPENLRKEARKVAARMFGLSPETTGPFDHGDPFGPYRIVKLLGAGGQAFVYQAEHSTLGRAVAIKIPRKDVAERLLKEARISARLDHPGIVRVEDLGEHESESGSIPYLVMELLEGGTLDHRLERNPEGLPLDDVHAIGVAILDALAYAHSKGVVHRDVKPSNVIFDADGAPRLTDLGIGTFATNAQDLDHSIDMSQLTGDGAIGTPLYMAPEQENPALLHGQSIDGRADLFSFGKMLFLMLTGANPRTIRPVSRMRTGLDPAWDELIFKLVEEDREARPATADEALSAFRALPLPASRVKVTIEPSELLAGTINVREKRESGLVPTPPEPEVPVATLVFPPKVPLGYLIPPGSERARWLFGAASIASLLFAGLCMWTASRSSSFTDRELLPLTVGAILAAFFLRRCRSGEREAKRSLGAFGAGFFSLGLAGWAPLLYASRFAQFPPGLSHRGVIALGWVFTVGTALLGVILLSVYRARRRPPDPPTPPGGGSRGGPSGPVVRARPRDPGGVERRMRGAVSTAVGLIGTVVAGLLAVAMLGLGALLNLL